ncbi:MAG: 23S rRNA (guanosine(2251)-2'-O)-methyltransferase RlmB [Cycloclasticus sp. symbiont of Poecilosclerida sp. M]|nr:MAG: 23S rRNA (guanosine(2251)-2'-O)-methyltransferase RlmB [Cycloclasticus sp. symbiont of Poecilosclerida sp. M]
MAEIQTIFGLHAVQALLANRSERILTTNVDAQRDDDKLRKLINALQQAGVAVQRVDKKTLEKLADGGNHQGLVVTVRLPEEQTEDALKKAVKGYKGDAFFLVLDQVTDPHNLGACLRTALAAGVQGVIVPKDNACRLTATVCKVASGAAESMPIYRVTNLVRTLKWLKAEGIWLTGAAGGASLDLYTSELKGSVAIVMGAEGKGLRQLTQKQCDQLVKIPMQKKVESLNVSVAAGIIMYEVVRQQNSNKQS